MSSIRQFAGQTIIYGLGSILSKLVYYLLVVVLLTYLLDGKEQEFGTYGELYGYVTVLIILFSLKLDTALFRYGSEKSQIKEAYNTTASLVFINALVLLALSFLFTEEIALFIDYGNKSHYVRWFGLILAFDILALIPFARLRLDNKAKVFASLRIFNVALSSSLIIFFLIIYPKVQDRPPFHLFPQFDQEIEYVFFTNVIASGILLLLVLRYGGFFKLSFSRHLIKKLIPYIAPLVIVGMCNNFIQYNGAAVIKYLSSTESLTESLGQSGIFDSSRRIAGLFVLFIGAFNYAAEPFFFNNSGVEDREAYYGKICHLFVLIGGIIILGLVLGLDIIKYLVGAGYRESIFIIPVLLMAYLFLGLYHNVSIWYKLSDKTYWGAYVSVAGVITTLLISYLFIPRYGYVAFAYANLASYLVMVLLTYLAGQHHYPIRYPIFKIAKSIAVIILLLVASQLLRYFTNGLLLYGSYLLFFSAYLLYVYYAEKEEWVKMLFKNRS